MKKILCKICFYFELIYYFIRIELSISEVLNKFTTTRSWTLLGWKGDGPDWSKFPRYIFVFFLDVKFLNVTKYMCSIWVVYICVNMCSCVTLPLKCVIISWNIQSFNYLQHGQVKTDTHLLVISMFGVELLPGAHPQRGVYHVHLAGDSHCLVCSEDKSDWYILLLLSISNSQYLYLSQHSEN